MMPLSWSVANVCSSRPSEPSAIQQNGTGGRSKASIVSSSTRTVSRSFSVDMKWVRVAAWSPWARSAPARRRIPCAAVRSPSRSRAAWISVPTSSTPTRWRANSCSCERRPARAPSASTTTRWWTPCSAIVRMAWCALACGPTVMRPLVITVAIGWSRSAPGSVTRRITSSSVKMPTGIRPRGSTTTTTPVRVPSIRCSVSRIVPSSGTVNGSRRTIGATGLNMVSIARERSAGSAVPSGSAAGPRPDPGCAHAFAPSSVADPRHEVARGERLRHVRVRAELQALLHLGVAPLRGQHQDLEAAPARVGADVAAHLESAHPREHHVEDDEVGGLLRERVEGRLAVRRDRDLVPLALHEELEGHDDVRLVVDDEDAMGHGPVPPIRPRAPARRRLPGPAAPGGRNRKSRAPRRERSRSPASSLTKAALALRGRAVRALEQRDFEQRAVGLLLLDELARPGRHGLVHGHERALLNVATARKGRARSLLS